MELVLLALGVTAFFGTMAVVLAGFCAFLWWGLHALETGEQREAARLEALGFVFDRHAGLHRALLPNGAEVLYQRQIDNNAEGVRNGFGLVLPAPSLQVHRLRPFGPSAHATGDPAFDEVYGVSGDPVDLALLTAPVRSALLSLSTERAEIVDGTLWVERASYDEELFRWLSRSFWTAHPARDDAEGRLWEVACDPVPGVRVEALRWACTHGDTALTAAIASSLAGDPEREVRGMAALVTGDGPALLAVVRSGEVSRPLRYYAAKALIDRGAVADRLDAAQVLAGLPEPALQRCAVDLLRSLGREGEPVLVDLLRTADSDALRAVVAALSEVGTVAAVPALRSRQAALSVLRSGLLREIDAAIASIQAGAVAPAGALALADDRGAGTLALAASTETLPVAARAAARRQPQ
jgi:hypothetical protein